jgi:glycosyltransferase involved in cell wall biosynthesis
MQKNKIFYIFHGRYPSEKAASIFAAKSVEALSSEGRNIILVVPRRAGCFQKDSFDYYGIEKSFKIIYIPIIDLFNIRFLSHFAFPVSNLIFSFFLFIYLIFNANRKDLIYSNEALPLIFSSIYFKNTFYEIHDFPERKLILYRFFLKRVRMILVTNNWKVNKLIDTFNLKREKILSEPNAVDISKFDILITKEDARKKLLLNINNFTVIYTGHLYSWKGVDTLAQTALLLPNILFLFIGGTEKDISNFKSKYQNVKNILIVGHKPYKDMPIWQKAADILVLPNTAKELISLHYTSPMKLFEYMCSRRPIIASNIPSLTEILNNSNSIIVKPDSAEDMAEGINEIFRNKVRADSVSMKAFSDVQKYTWTERAKRILGFVDKMM